MSFKEHKIISVNRIG